MLCYFVIPGLTVHSGRNRAMALMEETQWGLSPSFSHRGTRRWPSAIRKKAHSRTHQAGALMLNIQPPDVGSKCLWFASLGYFGTAAQKGVALRGLCSRAPSTFCLPHGALHLLPPASIAPLSTSPIPPSPPQGYDIFSTRNPGASAVPL
jgi:hypothetical protein